MVRPAGVTHSLTASDSGATALWVSELTGEAGANWAERGNVTVGAAGTFLFRSFGMSGTVKNGPAPGGSYGAITCAPLLQCLACSVASSYSVRLCLSLSRCMSCSCALCMPRFFVDSRSLRCTH